MILDESLFDEYVEPGKARGPYKKKELSDEEIFDKVFDKLQAKLISKHYKVGTDGNNLFVNARVVNKKLPNGRVVIKKEFLTDKKDYEDIIKYLDEANVKHEFKDSVQGLQLNILLDKDNAKDVNQEVLNRNARVKNEDLPTNRFKLKKYNDNTAVIERSAEDLKELKQYYLSQVKKYNDMKAYDEAKWYQKQADWCDRELSKKEEIESGKDKWYKESLNEATATSKVIYRISDYTDNEQLSTISKDEVLKYLNAKLDHNISVYQNEVRLVKPHIDVVNFWFEDYNGVYGHSENYYKFPNIDNHFETKKLTESDIESIERILIESTATPEELNALMINFSNMDIVDFDNEMFKLDLNEKSELKHFLVYRHNYCIVIAPNAELALKAINDYYSHEIRKDHVPYKLVKDAKSLKKYLSEGFAIIRTIEDAQREVDEQIEKFGRIGGGLYDDLDDAGFYVDENNKVQYKVKPVKEDYQDIDYIDNKIFNEQEFNKYKKYIRPEVILHYMYGYSPEEIAIALDMNAGTVATRIKDNLRQVREIKRGRKLDKNLERLVKENEAVNFDEILKKVEASTKTSVDDKSDELISKVLSGELTFKQFYNSLKNFKVGTRDSIVKRYADKLNESLEEDLSTFDYDKLQKELEAIPNVTKVDFDKDLIYDTKELVVLVNWHSDSDTAQWFRDKVAVKTKAIEVFKNNGLKLSDPVEDNGDYYYFVLREITPKAESLKEKLKEDYADNTLKAFIEGLKEEEEELKLDEGDITPESGDYYKSALNDIEYLCDEVTKELGKLNDTVKDHFNELKDQKLSIREIIKALISRAKESLNESLKEELSPEQEKEYGLTTMINSLIKDELEAIDGYNSAIVTLEAENKGEFTDVIRDIISEENTHIGQLQAILKELNPSTTADIDEGQQEGQEQIDQAVGVTKGDTEETTTTIDTEEGVIKTYKLDNVEKVEEN